MAGWQNSLNRCHVSYLQNAPGLLGTLDRKVPVFDFANDFNSKILLQKMVAGYRQSCMAILMDYLNVTESSVGIPKEKSTSNTFLYQHITNIYHKSAAGLQVCMSASLQVCWSASLHVCKCASLQVCGSAGLHVCKCASLQVCGSAGLQVCTSASVQVCRSAGLQGCSLRLLHTVFQG